MKRSMLAILALIFALAGLSAMDIREGTVRVKADPITGRIILYGLDMKSNARYEALIFDTDARTSFLTVSIDGRHARLGEDQEFRPTVRRIDRGLEVEYRSSLYTIAQRVEFIRSSGSRISDGFKISYILKNSSARDSKMGLKQILDTRLGEKSGVHFISDLFDKSDEERIFGPSDFPRFIATPGETSTLALLLQDIPRPDSVVLANWKRMADASWAYASPMRGYSLMPYSVNDSALGLYWNDRIVKAGSQVVLECYLIHGAGGVEFLRKLKEGQVKAEGLPAPAPSPAQKSSPEQPIEAKADFSLRIEEIKRLLESLDSAISGIQSITDEDVDALKTILGELEALSAQGGP